MSLIQNELTRRALAKERDRRSEAPTGSPLHSVIDITKRDDEKRLVFGFAKFSEDPANRGHYYVDRQGDIVTTEDLEGAAYDYVLHSRDGGTMHKTAGDATLVESFMVTPEKLTKMGLPGDALPAGWWVGFRINEPPAGQSDPWDLVKSGEYSAFSIEGLGRRDPVSPPSPVGKGNPTASSVHTDAPTGNEEESSDEDDTVSTYKSDGQPYEIDPSKEEARRSIYQMARNNIITSAEADQMLRNLVTAPSAGEREDSSAPPPLTDAQKHFMAEMINHLAMVQKMYPGLYSADHDPFAKHKGEDHPESSHGNRLFSEEAEAVGDLMKRLKTRFKRTDASTLTALREKFARASGPKAALSHDQIVSELARRNILPVKNIAFKSDRFKALKDEVLAAITADISAAESKAKEEA